MHEVEVRLIVEQWLWIAVTSIPCSRNAFRIGFTSFAIGTKSPVIAACPPPANAAGSASSARAGMTAAPRADRRDQQCGRTAVDAMVSLSLRDIVPKASCGSFKAVLTICRWLPGGLLKVSHLASVSLYRARNGGVPSRSAAVPRTRSAASAILSSLTSAWAGAVNWRPTGMPAWSRPTGIVIAQKPK